MLVTGHTPVKFHWLVDLEINNISLSFQCPIWFSIKSYVMHMVTIGNVTLPRLSSPYVKLTTDDTGLLLHN